MRSRTDVPDWPEVRGHLVDAGGRFPDTAFAVAALDEIPAVSWTDGPAGETFVDVVGELPGWTLVAGDPGGDVAMAGPTLFVRRDLSERAAAVAVVRFYAAHGRHWSAAEGPAGREAWRALVNVDDPARCGFPIPDMIAGLLLDAPDPGALPVGASTEEVLAAKLAAVGYEKLWAVAFAAVP